MHARDRKVQESDAAVWELSIASELFFAKRISGARVITKVRATLDNTTKSVVVPQIRCTIHVMFLSSRGRIVLAFLVAPLMTPVVFQIGRASCRERV